MGTFSTIRNVIGRGFCGTPKSIGMLLGLTVILASCGGSPSSGGGGSTPAPTATLSATSPITNGQSSTLTFTSTNATSCSINNNAPPVACNGSTSVSPTVTTTYTFTATGAGGTTSAPPATVTVNPALPPPPNPTVTLSVTPNATLAGATITLSWNSSNASSVVILDSSGGGPGGVQPNVPGSVSITSSQTTTYTATAYPEPGNSQQATATAMVTVNPITSSQGMDATQAEGGTTEDDIDPNGAVGTKQFLEYVNTSYQGYDKTTVAPVWSTPQPIGTPWGTNSNCSQTSIQLDVHIIFDRLATPPRWVIIGKSTRGTLDTGDYYLCVAISNTDDLTSTNPPFAWYAYYFDLVNFLGSNTSGPYYPDWPKVSTWPTSADGNSSYVVTMDMEDESSQEELGIAVCALNRNDLLTGNNGVSLLTRPATIQCFKDTTTLINTGIYLGHSLMPPDVDGNGTSTQPPPAGRDAYLASIENPIDPFSTNGPTTSSTINLWDLHVDWTTPTNSTFTLLSSPAVTTYWPGCYTSASPAQTICVPELGQGGGLQVDSVGDRFMPRFSYRNFGSYESFLISHTVQIGPGKNNCGTSCQLAQQTGIRWYELRANGSGTPTVSQQGTIAYNDSFFRFLPSIAQDQNGNAAVGYSISNPLNNPGISLSYWNLNPVNTNQPTEVTILNGLGEEIPFNPKTGDLVSSGQWGSYAMISVDPGDDCTFWYVNEYWPTTVLTGEPASWSTNISSFALPGCQ
jgi:hypothetical protein